jgi:hypothetical protein
MTGPHDPADHPERYGPADGPWARALFTLVLLMLFQVAQWVLTAVGVVQVLWGIVARERNLAVAEFGESLARWLDRTVRYIAGATEDKPFPWRRWGG